MSSSKKKQLRKEQYMTERQTTAAQEAKKLKRYTLTFWVVIALVICIFIGAVTINPIKNVVYQNTDAISVGDRTLSAAELNYFYIDAINSYYSTCYSTYYPYYSSYWTLFLGFDPSEPLDEQAYTTDTTWASYFLTSAQNTIKSTYALYDLAIAAGHSLSESEQSSIDSTLSNLSLYATLYGYSSVNAYLRGTYGNGATEASYRTYLETSALASSYLSAYSDSLEFSTEDLVEYDNTNPYTFNSFTYASHYLNYSKFQEGQTDDDGNFVYDDDAAKEAAIEAAREAAKKAAEELAAGNYEDLDAFDQAIQELDKTVSGKEESTTVATKQEELLFSEVDSVLRYWIAGYELKDGVNEDEANFPEDYDKVERKEGDMTVIANTSGTGDSKTVNGYYVVRFGSMNDNTFALKNVRHILVAFEGGTTDSDGNKTYSDEEKAEAKAKAELLLAQWEAGAKTEDSFAELANKESADTGSNTNGGLYEDIYPDQMIPNFNDWVYDESRKSGDYGIVEGTSGYHIIYFSGLSLTSYRNYMVENALRSETVENWYNEQVEAMDLKVLTTKYVELDMVISHSH